MKDSMLHYLRQVCSVLTSVCLTITALPLPANSVPAFSTDGSRMPVSNGSSASTDSKAFPRAGALASLAIQPSIEPAGATSSSSASTLVPNRRSPDNRDLDRNRPPIPPTNNVGQPKIKSNASVTTLGAVGGGFVENKGQWDSHARFQLSGRGKTLWLSDTGIVFDNLRPKPDSRPANPIPPAPGVKALPTIGKFDHLVFSENFVGIHLDTAILPSDAQPGAYNFLFGNDPTKWRTNAHAYGSVIYHDVWDGVDVRIGRNGADLEQEFAVRPGADPGQIQISYNGIEGLEVAKDGSLLVHTAYGDLRETAPRLYQEIAGKRIALAGSFRLLDKTSYTFDVASHDSEYAVVIDPTLLYSTYLGGNGGGSCNFGCGSSDQGEAIAVDSSGNAYVTGLSGSSDWPVTAGAFETTATLGAFVTKLNPLGSQIVYSTAISGNYGDRGYGIAVDNAGEAYIVGVANTGYPTTSNAYQLACASSASAFLTKLSAAGDALLYSTCLGSSSIGQGIALDSNGRAYIVGYVNSAGLPTTAGAFQPSSPTTTPANVGFFAVLDPSTSGTASLAYSTYLGGTTGDSASSVAVDAYGMAYVGGHAGSTDFPVTAGAYQTTFGNPSNGAAFVSKLNPNASGSPSLIYSTFVGGTGFSAATGIAVDSLGDAYITGEAVNSFPVSGGPFPGLLSGASGSGSGGFIAKVNPAGNGLVYSSFLGADASLEGTGVATDVLGDAYVTGFADCRGARTNTIQTTLDAFQPTCVEADGQSAFVMKIDVSGTLIYSSYLGGLPSNAYIGTTPLGIAVDATGDAYVTGFTTSPNFPVTSGVFQSALDPNTTNQFPTDAFVTKFPLSQHFRVLQISPTTAGNAGRVTVTITGTGLHSGFVVKLTGNGQSDILASSVSVDSFAAAAATFDLQSANALPGLYNFVVTSPDGSTVTLPFLVQQGGEPRLAVNIVGPSALGTGHGAATFSVIVSNQGNVDAQGVIVSLYGVPSEAALQPLFSISAPPIFAGEQAVDFSQTPFAPVLGQQQIPTLLISGLPPGTTVTLPFSLAITSLPAVPPLMPLAPGSSAPSLGTSSSIQLTAIAAQINDVCTSSSASDCLQSAISAAASLLQSIPIVGQLLSIPSCVKDSICLGLMLTLAKSPRLPQRIFNFNQVFAKFILDCGGVLPAIGTITKLIQAAGTIINLYWDCIYPVLNNVAISLATFLIKTSIDPSDKEGISGLGVSRWTSGSQRLSYGIYFLNEPTATAAAQNVVVTDILDPSIDTSTMTLDAIVVNGVPVPVAPILSPVVGQNQSAATIDFRPAQSLLVNVNASFNPLTDGLTLTFSSTDSTTGLAPADPATGVLPPGVGGVLLYSALPKQALSTGTQVNNQAVITFDTNPSMSTPTWSNTIDNTPPTSLVTPMPTSETSPSFTVQWSGTDIGSGIHDYTVYVSDNGAAYTAFQTNTATTSAAFTGQTGHTYTFYSVARDLVGNVEVKSPVAEATTSVPTNLAPTFTSIGTATFQVGVLNSFTVLTSGFPVSGIVETGSLPSGLTFIDNGNGTATISGTPAVGSTGSYSVALVAQNGVSPNASQSFTLVVDQLPAITSAATATFQSSMTSSFTVTTTGFPTAAITESGALPTGVTFVDNGNGTATLAGTPTAGGVFNLTITAANAVTPNATQSFTLTVNQTPTFTSATGATFQVGTPGSFSVATNGFPTATLTETGGLPAGVTFVNNGNGTATLAGTPSANGIYGITLNASSTSGAAAQSFTLTVNQTPAFSSASATTLLAGTASSFSVTSIGFPVPSLTEAGTLPAGLIFASNGNGTGTVAGTPSASGIFNLSFTATNAVSATQQAFTLTVDQTPSFSSSSAATFQSGSANSFTVATAGFPTAVLAATGALPSGVTFVDNHNGTGTLSGNPSANGTFNISLMASNSVATVSQSFILTVVGATSQLSISPTSLNFANVYLLSLQSKIVTVQNLGSSPVSMGKPSITLSTNDKDDFTLLNSCGSSLPAGHSCTITVFYLADDVETSSATLNIADSAAGSPQQVSLRANVINPVASFNPSSVNFGTLKVGTSSTKTETLTNFGTTALNLTSITVIGTNASDFNSTPTCPSSLAPKASCTISVKFTPGATGNRSAGLSFVDNARTQTQTIPLVGKGN
jgi:hypothetical protein